MGKEWAGRRVYIFGCYTYVSSTIDIRFDDGQSSDRFIVASVNNDLKDDLIIASFLRETSKDTSAMQRQSYAASRIASIRMGSRVWKNDLRYEEEWSEKYFAAAKTITRFSWQGLCSGLAWQAWIEQNRGVGN